MNTRKDTAALIVAVGRNGEIGHRGDLLWHLPGDLQYFKRTTLGHPLIMGRKTFESIGRALPGRISIVVSHDAALRDRIDATERCKGVCSIEQAFAYTKTLSEEQLPFPHEAFVTGGGQIYRQALEKGLVDRIYLTVVDADYPHADTFFPMELLEGWHETSCEKHPAQDGNPAFEYRVLTR